MSDRNVVTEEEKIVIMKWIHKNLHRFDKKKQYTIQFFWDVNEMQDDQEAFNAIKTIEQRIILKENLQTALKTSVYGNDHGFHDFIYVMSEGNKLHGHKDKNLDDNHIHVRFNTCIQAPERGGDPIYGGKKIKLNEGEYVVCRSGLDFHTSSMMWGAVQKVVISYGFFIDKSKIDKYPNG